VKGMKRMKLTLTCDCGNTDTIEINELKMNGSGDVEDTIYVDDFERKNQKFTHEQHHPDEVTIGCTQCQKTIQLKI
jgi:hypothetical protein